MRRIKRPIQLHWARQPLRGARRAHEAEPDVLIAGTTVLMAGAICK